jgi:uncharacterized protein (DUF2062 family)
VKFDFMALVPGREELLASRWIRPFRHRLVHPAIWHLTRRSVARGLALGLLMAFVVPLGQTLAAAVLALSLRANLLVAAAATLVTNPLTIAPIYFAAYRLGGVLLGDGLVAVQEAGPMAGWIISIVAPTLAGLLVFGATAAFLGYHLALLVGRWRIVRRRRARQRKSPALSS